MGGYHSRRCPEYGEFLGPHFTNGKVTKTKTQGKDRNSVAGEEKEAIAKT